MNEYADLLAEAEQQIADAEVRLAGVHAHIAELELGNRDASAALKVLEELEGALELMRRQRDVIARLLQTHGGC
jgi:septal ring factor EnvC (AmiA/AmiB activator)